MPAPSFASAGPEGAAVDQEPAGPRDTAAPLPITAVTCLEDRAQVERTGTVRLSAGVQRLVLGPVTPLAVDRSLRAELSTAPATHPGEPDDSGADGCGAAAYDPRDHDPHGHDPRDPAVNRRAAWGRSPEATAANRQVARVVDARVVRAYTPPPPGEPGRDASRLRRDVHALERELYDAQQLARRQEIALAVVDQARADVHRDIVQGAGAGAADPERWADRLDRVDEETERRTGELHRLRRRAHDIGEELREAREALAATESEPRVLTAHLELVVEAQESGDAELRVTHLVPCALWRPAYRGTLTDDRGGVRLETDAFVWQATGEDWNGVGLSLSTARPTLAASPPELAEDVLTLRDRSAQERRTVEVSLREEEIRSVGGESPAAGGGFAGLPGLDDGGAVRTLTVPHPVDIPSDGRPHRVGLSSFTAPCRAELACAPELSPLLVTTAHFANTSGHVLLAGPVDLLRGSGFVGRAELAFAGVGEEVRLAFGSEDTFRVVRDVEESRDTTGLAAINQRTVITRRVRLFVSRLDAQDGGAEQEVVIRERVPVSEVSAVEVRVRTDSSSPEPDEGDDEGVVRWTLRLGPGERREIILRYDLTLSGSVEGL